MRILIAHSRYRVPGGEDIYVRQQTELLQRKHEIALHIRENSELGGPLRAASAMTLGRKEQRQITSTVESFRPDVVHLHNAYPALGPAVHRAINQRDIPLVMTVHNYRLRCPNGYMFTEGQVCRRCESGFYQNAVIHRCFPHRTQASAYATVLWFHRFILRLESRVAVFIAPSDFMRRQLIEWGIPAAKVRLVRNFTDLIPLPKEAAYSGIYVGRLSAEKGLLILLQALKEASDPPFTVVGDGPLGDDLRRRARELRLSNVEFVGRVDQNRLKSLLASARFAVFPSLWHENAPLAALEAMAAACPLIASDRGGLPELAQSGRGLLCTAGDISQLAEAIKKLLSNDGLFQHMSRRAVEFVASDATPDVHLAKLENVYEQAINN